MADKIIQKLTHDNNKFEEQWYSTRDFLQDSIDECNEKQINVQGCKIKALDALADYVLTDLPSLKPFNTKFLFLEHVVTLCSTEPQPALADLVRILRRILDQPNIFNEWHLSFIEEIYKKFELGTRLSEKPSTNLIESILKSLQKQTFLNGSSYFECEDRWIDFFKKYMFSSGSSAENQLTTETTMIAMRPSFQQFFKYAVKMSSRSNVWAKITYLLKDAMPSLLDSSSNPEDALAAIEESELSVSCDLLKSLASSYKSNANRFKENFSHILNMIERLVLNGRMLDAGYFIEETIEANINTVVDIGALVKMFTQLCPKVKVNSRGEFYKHVFLPLSATLESTKLNKKFATALFDFAISILDLITIEAPECTLRLLGKEEFYQWNAVAPHFRHVIQSCAAYDVIVSSNHFTSQRRLEEILEFAFERSQVFPSINQATHNEALTAILRWLGSAKPKQNTLWCCHVYRMGRCMVDLIDQRQVTVDTCGQLIEALHGRIAKSRTEDESDNETNNSLGVFCTVLMSKLSKCIDQMKRLPEQTHRQIASFISDALAQPLKREDGENSFTREMVMFIWIVIGPRITNENEVHIYKQCLKQIHSLSYEYADDEDFFMWWSIFWNLATIQNPHLAIDYVAEFLSDLLDRKYTGTASVLPNLYVIEPEPFHIRLTEMITGMFSKDQAYSIFISELIRIIAKEHPEVFTAEQVDLVFSLMKSSPPRPDGFVPMLEALGSVTNVQPHLFHKHRNQLLFMVSKTQNESAFHCLQQYFIASTMLSEGKTADEYLTILMKFLKENPKMKNEIRKHIFHSCGLIGMINKQALEAKRNDLVAFQKYAECRLLLDFIDGKKLSDENRAILNQTRQEITQMEKLVAKTGKDVQDVTKVMKQQEIKVTNLHIRVNEVDTKLDDVNQQCQVHASEIKRIDAKTLSHVPTEWGDQVCKLLNQKTSNDWRLLGKRFGYSTSELRHWYMQANPCMSLLNEWFMTHKADEATYGLVKTLDDIGRKDVSEIIRKATTAASHFIPDDMLFEIKRLPPVFLSYQWGTQKAVTTLKENLEEAGYACWMDIGQMGGGDKLFAKIDAGIRGAKVIICCMSTAYAQSDNCSREVHLAISTGKPLIPLQMEKQKWPPEGALGPIMSEYLYIRFYDRKSNANNYWPADKFPELLGQIRYHTAPNPDMIGPRYRNWYQPQIDNLIFLQPAATNEKHKQVALQDNVPLDVAQPQVMISYQWDRQTDIIALYKLLTRLGYRCWLDIFQMGGGDSLFEKIDAGIRNAKCILACVTPNYTKSTNCRREMSLSDALGKHIVPLLLETTETWPPSGPMALVFTDKSYIDFSPKNPNYQKDDIWSSMEIKEMIDRLKTVIPEVKIDQSQNFIEGQPAKLDTNVVQPNPAPSEVIVANNKPTKLVENTADNEVPNQVENITVNTSTKSVEISQLCCIL